MSTRYPSRVRGCVPFGSESCLD